MEEELEKAVVSLTTLKSQLSQTNKTLQEIEHGLFQVDQLQSNQVKLGVSENDIERELELLWGKVKDTLGMLTYLKPKPEMTQVPHLVHTLSGTGTGNRDEGGNELVDDADDEGRTRVSESNGTFGGYDRAYVGEMLKSVQDVADLMGDLVKWVIMAENKTALEKEKVCLGKEEMRRRILQFEILSAKLEEMKRFASRTDCVLDEMWKKVEDLVQEISTQSRQAVENERELGLVRQEFESLRLYVTTLMNVRETLLLSEGHFLTIERLSERLVSMTTCLEAEKVQKEAEIDRLMAENVRLLACLDKKEAQLVAMNEQCKVMALNASSV